MFIPIPIHYKYKVYPYAPGSTRKSMALGILTSFVSMCIWSFLVFGLVGYVLIGCGACDEMAYGIGALFVIPFIYGVLKWKKCMERKLDEAAAVEMMKMMLMAEKEKALAARHLRKK